MDFDTLSDDAKAVGHSLFPTLGSKATFHMVESVPTDECQAALNELVDKGFVTVEPLNRFGGLVYKPKASFGHLAGWAWKRAMSGVSMTLWHRRVGGEAARAPS